MTADEDPPAKYSWKRIASYPTADERDRLAHLERALAPSDPPKRDPRTPPAS